MTRPEDTARRSVEEHVVGAMAQGTAGYITGMEAAGQRELVHSDTLPSDAPWQALEALGFAPGEVIKEDPLFRYCSLPEGWRRVGSDHAMWSHVIDDRGLKRVAVFYKAAFYDRSAHATITDPGRDLASHIVYGDDEPALPDEWPLLNDSERAQFVAVLQEYMRMAIESPRVYGPRAERARRVLRMVES